MQFLMHYFSINTILYSVTKELAQYSEYCTGDRMEIVKM